MTTPEGSELAAAESRVRQLAAEAETLISADSPSTQVVPSTGVPAETLRAAAAEMRASATHKALELQQAKEVLQREYEQALQRAKNALVPLQAHLDRLKETVWSINLYLGREEEIVCLMEGEPASADTPLTIRQLVLAMDEESLVAADSGGIDARSIEGFDQWITEDPAHLHQVLPEPKGVVVLVPSRQQREYGDAWSSARMEEANAHSWWLIRNGERLYRMSTDFQVGKHLVAPVGELEQLFTTKRYVMEGEGKESWRRVPIEPGGSEWAEAERLADAKQRHYMRAVLILQGLVDRTTVFHPLHPEGLNLLDQRTYDSGRVKLVTDAENALTTGRLPFREWLRECNAKTEPGMRIVGAFGYAFDSHYRGRISPATAIDTPKEGVIHQVERGSNGMMCIKFERTQLLYVEGHYKNGVWIAGELRPPLTRATCRILPSDEFFICIDGTSIEEMEGYLAARTERASYLKMVPLLKAAVAAKRAEQEAEGPFLQMLAGHVAAQSGDSIETLQEALPELVRWWKFGRKWHQPLVAGEDPKREQAAITAITTEYLARRVAPQDIQAEREMVEWFRSEYGAMLVGRTNKGRYTAFAPMKRRYTAPSLGQNVYVEELNGGLTARSVYGYPWTIISPRRLATLRVLWSDKRWEGWRVDTTPGQALTDDEVDKIIAALRSRVATLRRPSSRSRGVGDATVEGRGYGKLAAITHESNQYGTDITAWMYDESEPWNEGDFHAIRFDTITVAPYRTVGQKLEWEWRVPNSEWYRVGVRENPLPWNECRGRTLLWGDDGVIGGLAQVIEMAGAEARAEAALQERARAVVISVRTAWENRELERAYARFLQDFADPQLWEGHLKTLKQSREPEWIRNEIHRAALRVLRAGVDIEGMRVDQLVEQANSLVSTSQLRVTITNVVREWRLPQGTPGEESTMDRERLVEFVRQHPFQFERSEGQMFTTPSEGTELVVSETPPERFTPLSHP